MVAIACIFSLYIWLVCVSEHCTRNFNAFWIFIVSVWLAPKALLSIGLGMTQNPSTVLFVPLQSFGIVLAEDRVIYLYTYPSVT